MDKYLKLLCWFNNVQLPTNAVITYDTKDARLKPGDPGVVLTKLCVVDWGIIGHARYWEWYSELGDYRREGMERANGWVPAAQKRKVGVV